MKSKLTICFLALLLHTLAGYSQSFIVLASVVSAGNILDFSDLLLLAMAFPNIIGLYLLQGKISAALKEYLAKLRSGELDKEVEKS